MKFKLNLGIMNTLDPRTNKLVGTNELLFKTLTITGVRLVITVGIVPLKYVAPAFKHELAATTTALKPPVPFRENLIDN